jgi:hypothetical protein
VAGIALALPDGKHRTFTGYVNGFIGKSLKVIMGSAMTPHYPGKTGHLPRWMMLKKIPEPGEGDEKLYLYLKMPNGCHRRFI